MTLELILNLPVWIIVLLAVIQFGQLLSNLQQVALASRVGATEAMVPQGDFHSGAVYFFRFDGGEWVQQ